jgi:hypothetical protein
MRRGAALALSPSLTRPRPRIFLAARSSTRRGAVTGETQPCHRALRCTRNTLLRTTRCLSPLAPAHAQPPRSKKLAPAWDQLGDYFARDGRVTIAKVDCTTEKGACAQAEARNCTLHALRTHCARCARFAHVLITPLSFP